MARRNLLFLVVVAAVGGAIGVWVASQNPTYRATATLGVRTASDAAQSASVTESAAYTVTSPVVIEAASEELNLDPGLLAEQVSASVQPGTSLIEVTAANTDADRAVDNVTTVANVAIEDYRTRSAAIGEDVRVAGEELLKSGKLTEETAERTRQESIGTVVGSAQGQSIQGTVTLSIVSPALGASIGGVGTRVGLVLGSAVGLLLGLLIVLSGVWRSTRKVRSAADLEDIGVIRGAFSATEVSDLAGTVLEAGPSYVVMMGADGAARKATSDAVSAGLRRNGYSVAQVAVLGAPDQSQHLTRLRDNEWAVGVEMAGGVLSRAERGRLAKSMATDLVVVELANFPEASGFLAGQKDFVPILIVRRGRRIARVERDLRPIAAAGPVVVLTG